MFFIHSVPNYCLLKLFTEFYPAAEYIIRQGETGDTFFIISNGQVHVTQKVVTDDGLYAEEEIRCLGRGEYFGEQALLREERRTANVIAMDPGVECLTLNRESFNQLIGDLQELQTKDYGDEDRMRRISNLSSPSLSLDEEFKHIMLDDLDVLATLGVGGFGRVQLNYKTLTLYSRTNMNIRFLLERDGCEMLSHRFPKRISERTRIDSSHHFVSFLRKT
ncbi:cGMP-dependent protein kinase, isozyme 1 [Trichonephila clavipes]|nr:cGMP-dependent protein kinase, isozyme 1 [Trichonephila clavipes]